MLKKIIDRCITRDQRLLESYRTALGLLDQTQRQHWTHAGKPIMR